jgi:hypothetical protein
MNTWFQSLLSQVGQLVPLRLGAHLHEVPHHRRGVARVAHLRGGAPAQVELNHGL